MYAHGQPGRQWLNLPTSLQLAVVIVLLPFSFGFTPFSPTKDVCPRCRPYGDVLQLASGELVHCRLVAQNADYFVLERFGEYRALPRNEAAAVAWKNDETRELPTDDQILLKQGLLLHGRIVRTVRDMYHVIDVRGREHIVWFSEIASMHHEGVLQPNTALPPHTPAPAAPAAPQGPTQQ